MPGRSSDGTHGVPVSSDRADTLVDALAQTAFVTTAVLSRVAAEHDLSLTQLRVLGILRDRQMRVSVLARHLGLEKSTLSGLIDRAERRGLVHRAPNPQDGRAVDVMLSAAGVRLAAAVRDQVRRELAPTTGRLSAPERRRLEALLQQILVTPDGA